MNALAALVFFLGAIAFVASLVALAVKALQKKPKPPWPRILAGSFAAVIVSAIVGTATHKALPTPVAAPQPAPAQAVASWPDAQTEEPPPTPKAPSLLVERFKGWSVLANLDAEITFATESDRSAARLMLGIVSTDFAAGERPRTLLTPFERVAGSCSAKAAVGRLPGAVLSMKTTYYRMQPLDSSQRSRQVSAQITRKIAELRAACPKGVLDKGGGTWSEP